MRSSKLSERPALILGALLLIVAAESAYSTFTLLQRIAVLEATLTARMDYGDRELERIAEKTEASLSRISFQCVTAKLELQRVQGDLSTSRVK